MKTNRVKWKEPSIFNYKYKESIECLKKDLESDISFKKQLEEKVEDISLPSKKTVDSRKLKNYNIGVDIINFEESYDYFNNPEIKQKSKKRYRYF